MATLIKLRLVQIKGTLRGLFSKPSSAIITVLVVLLYGSLLAPLILSIGKPRISDASAYNMILYVAGFSFFLILMTLLQNRRSLFFLSDAHYLYTGPFSSRKVLGAYAIDCLSSALLFGLLSLIPVVMGASSGSVPPLLILTAFVASTLSVYGLLAINGILYVHELIGAQKNRGQLFLIAGLVAIAAGLCFAAFSQSGFQLQVVISKLTQGSLLNWLPLFGWSRLAMVGVWAQDALQIACGLGLLLGFAALATLILVNIKGDFYERSMTDAEAFTDYYKRSKSGQDTGGGKVHKASLRFRRREGAIYSKNLLMALKGRDLFRPADLLVIGIYLAMAYFMGMGFLTFAGMLMFWMFMAASTSSLVDDLSHHYVYLIPGSNLKKLLSTVVIPLIKSAIVLLISLIAGGLLLGAASSTIVSSVIFCLTMLLVFAAGNVLSLRMLRSRSNKVLEQALRMFFTMIALAPGLIAFFLASFLMGDKAADLAAPIFATFNLVFSVLVLLLCAPMMQGNELNAD